MSAALSNTWTGQINTDWNNPGNWSENVVPGAGDSLVIPANPTGGNQPFVLANSYSSVTIGGTGTVPVTNDGVVTLAAATDEYANLVVDGDVVLSGTGSLVLTDSSASAGNQIYTNVAGSTLDNQETISGAGTFLNSNSFTLLNDATGTVNANGVNALSITKVAVVNEGLIEATGAGGLDLTNETVSNSGTIEALDGSQIVLSGATIAGGTLESSGAGFVLVAGDSTLDGSTATGPVNFSGMLVNNQQILDLTGEIDNSGVLQINAAQNTTFLDIAGATTLKGPGVVQLVENGGQAEIEDRNGAQTLDNQSTIEGAGVIVGYTGLTLTNEANGLIEANDANALTIRSVDLIDRGLIEATGAGGLDLTNITVTNSGGTIEALAGSQISLAAADIIGGTLTGLVQLPGGLLGGDAELDGATAGALSFSGNLAYDQETLFLQGEIDNSGAIELDSTENGTYLNIVGATTLKGTGVIQMVENGGQAKIEDDGGALAEILDNQSTIEGCGQIVGNLDFTNEAGGLVDATDPNNALEINLGNNVPVNDGVLEADGSGGSNGARPGGYLWLQNGVQGTGALLMKNGGEIQVDDGSSGQSVAFIGAGELLLTSGGTLGTISGFGVGDKVIGAFPLLFPSATYKMSFVSASKGVETFEVIATLGDISFDDGSFNFAGNYAAADFNLGIDATTGLGVIGYSGGLSIAQFVAETKIHATDEYAILDSAANIEANLATLTAWADSIASITASDAQVSVGTDLFGPDQAPLDEIVGGFAISDTAANVAKTIDSLNGDSQLSSIILTDAATPILTLTAAQALNDTAALGKIVGAYSVIVSDTAADVAANLDALNADAHLVSILLTDAGTPVLTLTAAQALNDTAALGKIAGAYSVALSDTAADLQKLTPAQIAALAAEGVTTLLASDAASLFFNVGQSAALTGAGIRIVAQLGQSVVESANGGAFDVQYFTPGTYQGVTYETYDVLYAGQGAPTSTVFEDASGKTVASVTLANGQSDTRLVLPGTFDGLTYAASETIALTNGFIEQKAYYDVSGNELADETFTPAGVQTIYVGGVEQTQLTINPDGSFDMHYFTAGSGLGVSWASDDVFYSAPGVQSKTLYEAASGKTVASITRANGATDVYLALPGTFDGLSYAAEDTQTLASGFVDQQTFYNASGNVLGDETYTPAGVQTVYLGGVEQTQLTINPDGSFDMHYFIAGSGQGVTWASDDVFYSAPGVHTKTLYEDGSGGGVASVAYAADGSTTLEIPLSGGAATNETILTAKGFQVATALDNSDGSGALTLDAQGLTVNIGQGQLGVASGADVFALTAHTSETIAAGAFSNESFVFGAGFGQDLLSGFSAASDTLTFNASAFGSGLTAGQALLAMQTTTTANLAGDAVIHDVYGDSLTLSGFKAGDLSAAAAAFKFV